MTARSDTRLIGIGQRHNKVVRACGLCCGDYLFHCGIRLRVADIVGYCAYKQIDVLRHEPDIPSDNVKRQVAHIDSVDFDTPCFRVIETRYQIGYCCFARSGLADYSEHLTCVHLEVKILYYGTRGLIFKFET